MTPSIPDKVDILLMNCRLATMSNHTLSVVNNGAVAVTGRKISWTGKEKSLPENLKKNCRTIDCRNNWVLPGFVDCHTHLVWAGSRSNEFEMRLAGSSYEEISNSGGGILSTVRSTRSASKEELFLLSEKRVKTLLNQGITTLEIKSGYGLDLETELKILDVIKQLDTAFDLHIEPTFLGAHTLPREFKGSPDRYVDLVTETMLPKVRDQHIATAVDVFCENIAFTPGQTKKIFNKAKELAFNIKLHAEQLSDSNGAALAARFGALSCDHLEYLSKKSAEEMAKHNVVAVMLPGAYYYLNQTQKPPIDLLRRLEIPMAVATDLNPGSSPVHAMTPILNMACVLFGMTCEEALLGATINGARALGLEKTKGSLEPGKDADLVVWDIDRPADLCYLTGLTPVKAIMIQGRLQLNTLQ